jgi:hypothetical protein
VTTKTFREPPRLPRSTVFKTDGNSTLIDSRLEDVPAINDDRPAGHQVPLTIISGFLGAGKSTLLKWVYDIVPYLSEAPIFLRRILTEHHGYRIAVIMNEFGDTAVRYTSLSVLVASLLFHIGYRMLVRLPFTQ